MKLEAVELWMEDDGGAPDMKTVASSEVVLVSLCFMKALERSVALLTLLSTSMASCICPTSWPDVPSPTRPSSASSSASSDCPEGSVLAGENV